ncbi:MAG: hypothetical protein LAO56_13230 [Acidobacteriia bacterium]|nr:hypothetical protein [Terriglobia bacterium]
MSADGNVVMRSKGSVVMRSEGSVSQKELSVVWQLVVLVTFLLAVLASHFLDSYMAGAYQGGVFADWSWHYLLLAAIVTVAAYPIVYQRVSENRNAPTLVQIATVFLTGMGWDKLLSAVHYVGKPPTG